jgi:putative polyketide hydroxylase
VDRAWTKRDADRVSTLDLVGRRFVLLAGPDAGSWCDAAGDAATKLGVPIDCEQVAEHDELGLRTDGALLVRPDGIVAWPSKRSGERESLTRAFEQILRATGSEARA